MVSFCKLLKNKAPANFEFVKDTHNVPTRSSITDLKVPKVTTEFGKSKISYTGCPQKNVPCHIWWYYFAIFNQRFNFLQWVEKQSYYINRSIYLTKRLNRLASRDT